MAELHVVALSGGKDSTALALGMHERGLHVDAYLTTPTGDELPEMAAHWRRLAVLLGQPPIVLPTHTLDELVESQRALPNFRMRWCTRMLKIEPCLAWAVARQAEGTRVVMYVGLRADEPTREGIYDSRIEQRHPFREWGWGIKEVLECLRRHEVQIPRRTDCARCYHQRLGEWWDLWKNYPEIYASAEAQEAWVSAERGVQLTFRNSHRDTWPADLAGLRARFESGDAPPSREFEAEEDRLGVKQTHLPILDDFDLDEIGGRCRVCSM